MRLWQRWVRTHRTVLRLMVLASALLLPASACTEGRRVADEKRLAANACVFRAVGSRWAGTGTSFEQVAAYGDEPGEDLGDLWGMATSPEGDVLLWDAGRTHVLRLDRDLRPIQSYGRDGPGPGEFAYQRAVHGNWITAKDSSFLVLDYRAISEFSLRSGFIRYVVRGVPFTETIPRLAKAQGKVLYASDVIDRQTGSRVLDTWELRDSAPPARLRADSMPPLPRWQGRPVRGIFADQADPLWAVGDNCLFISDGAGDWLLAVDVTSNRADTLGLPPKQIPERTAADSRRRERLRQNAARMGISAGSEAMKPTARMKWDAMVVDPDGFVWLKPWRPFSQRDEPLYAWIINPRTGAVDSLEVPRFPWAFLPDGAYVTVAVDDRLGTSVIQAFESRRPAGPGS